MPTDFLKLDRLTPLPASELPRQWLLTHNHEATPEGWSRRERMGWHLAHHPDAHVCDLRSADGRHLGWIIEPLTHLTCASGEVPDDHVKLDVPHNPSGEELEAALYGRDRMGLSAGTGVEGMWVAIVLCGSGNGRLERIYLGAIHSIVFSEDHRTVAATHNLMPRIERDEALSRAFDPLETRRYYTFGLTPFRGIRRLLPNHFLDLESFRPGRHWPRDRLPALDSGQEGAEIMVRHGRRLLSALSTRYTDYKVFLSAGRDSRAVLALTRPLVAEGRARVRLVTTVGKDLPSRIDGQAARRLAKIAGLPHEVNRRKPHVADTDAVMRAFVRIGESKAGPVLSAPGVTDPRQADPAFILSGMAGETARSYFWPREGLPESVTPALLAERTSSPMIKPVLDAAERWLADLPPALRDHGDDILDLAYVEQRLGCWESSSRYLFPGRPRVLSPMATALSIETMLRLPTHYREEGRLQCDMVAYGWPDLLQVPVNRPAGWLRLRSLARNTKHRMHQLLS